MKRVNFKNMKNKLSSMACAIYCTVFFPTTVFASGTGGDPLGQITTGVNSVKTFFLGVVGAIGAIIFVRNASDFGAAIQDRDRNGMVSGLFGMIGGAVMALAGSILAIFGVS